MHKIKAQKGITLIALIITIILMLILVGVTITVALNGGLFTTAKEATAQTETEKEKEELLEAALGAVGEDGKVDFDKLDSSLPEGFTGSNGNYTSKTGNTFIVNKNTTAIQPVEGNAKIIGDEIGQYKTLQECIETIEDGDKIVITKDLSGEKVDITKSIEIVGYKGTNSEEKITLNNVSITIIGEDAELIIGNLNFTGTSYINANNAKSLKVNNVDADVTLNKTDSVTNSRAAFISLGAAEMNNKPLFVEIVGCNIVVTGNNSPNPVLGWRYIADGSLISGNTLGAEGKGSHQEVIKILNFMDGATITIKDNIVYTKEWNGFSLEQNTSKGNSYTAIIENNTFIGGNTDYIWVDNTDTGIILANIVANNNKIGNEPLKITDIKTNNQKVNSAVLNLEKDAEGKIIGGTYSNLTNNIEYVRENLADGYVLVQNSNGTYTVSKDN